ncbi:MAG: AMP-binding protein [Gammaproteobacteria bacterium]
MEFNAADIFEGVVQRIPEREALVLGETRLTYQELNQQADNMAAALTKIGITKGSHIGIYGYNSIEWIIVMLAAYKLCAIPININYRYVEEELIYLIDNADISHLFYQKEFEFLVAKIKQRLPSLIKCVSMDSLSKEKLNDSTLLDILEDAEGYEFSPPPRSGDDKYILYTGGTTGYPKGVVWRMEDVLMTLGGGIDPVSGYKYSSPEEFADKSLQPQINALALAPLMHGAAQWQTFNAFFSGWKLVLNDQVSFDPNYVWALVEKEKIMNLTITGDGMGRPLSDALAKEVKTRDLSSLFILTSTASMLSASIKETFLHYLEKLIIIDAVGASETGATGIHIFTKDTNLKGLEKRPRFAKTTYSAILHPKTFALIDPSDHQTIGYLARTGNVPIEYYKDPDKSTKTFIEIEGIRYSLPGDMAKYEENGEITLLGRGSISINSGGEKIFPEEVEIALKSHPNIFDCLVVGLEHEKWGESVAAVIQSRNGQKINFLEIRATLKDLIASYKHPKEIFFSNLIQRSPSGKPDYEWARKIALKLRNES